jgi:hypothetical protein
MKTITKEMLKKFCDENKIFYHKSASTDYLKAAIFRFVTNGKKSSSKSCFGFWEEDNSECSMCSYEEKCFKLSIGEEKKKYERVVAKSLDMEGWLSG